MPKTSLPHIVAFLDRILAGESLEIACDPDVRSPRGQRNRISNLLRELASRWADDKDATCKKYYDAAGRLDIRENAHSIVVKLKGEPVLKDVSCVPFSVKGSDGRLSAAVKPVIKASRIEDEVKKHERDVIEGYESILKTGMSMLNRVNVATSVIEQLSDSKTAPDWREKLLHLQPLCFDVFREAIAYDPDECDGGNKEKIALEGAKVRCIKYLADKQGGNTENLWPPDTANPKWKERMERARKAARCTATTPGRLFENPAVLYCFYDENFNNGRYVLNDWQTEEQAFFASPLTPKHPVHFQATVAANSSGKSAFLGAPAAIWGSIEHPSARTVLTSSSGAQLDYQAAGYIKALAERMNSYHGGQLWDIKYRTLEFLPLHSDIILFATNEPGRAEGWHAKIPDGYFAILCDEAKTIGQDIFEALARCHDCNRRWDYSSPGQPAGHFYNVATSTKGWRVRKVTAFDCAHIKRHQIDSIIDEFGPDSPITRSSIYAEFTNIDGNLVVTRDKVNRCLNAARDGVTVHKPEEKNRAGLDLALSAGGDESVFSVWNGNRQIAQEVFRESELEREVDKVIALIHKYDLQDNLEDVVADAGGLGKPVLQRLRDKGYKVTWYHAQSQPKTAAARNFASRGTECWFKLGRMIERCQIILKDDPTLISQLSERYYKQSAKEGKIVMEPKPEAKANGHPSPDRADAAVLANAFWDADKEAEAPVKDVRRMSESELLARYDEIPWSETPDSEISGAITLEELVSN